MATITGLLGSLTHWLVLASQWFHDWDITLLTSALIVLIVIAGVTGRAAMGPRLWMQLVWGTATVVVGLIEVAIIWTTERFSARPTTCARLRKSRRSDDPRADTSISALAPVSDTKEDTDGGKAHSGGRRRAGSPTHPYRGRNV